MRPLLVLASASPRRLELLRAVGLQPVSRPSGLDESGVASGAPADQVLRLAEAKGRHVATQLGAGRRDAVVLAADTAVVLGDEMLGKPRDAADARRMLRRLSGREHEVLTGVYVWRRRGDRRAGVVARTAVRFRELGERTVRWYVDTGEPMDKAGAYGIQGRGALLAERIDGSWANVVGLPLERLPSLFGEIGLDVLDLAGAR